MLPDPSDLVMGKASPLSKRDLDLLGVSLDNGFALIGRLNWSAYHEGKDLIPQVEEYFKIHGFYPELVQVDKAYSTRENRAWLKERNIRITAPQLGRRPKKEAAERNHIEAKFGQGKNGYNLNTIRAKLMETSESWVSCIFFVMNLINFQKKLSLGALFYQLLTQLDHVIDVKRLQRCNLYFEYRNFKQNHNCCRL